jgi:membrane protease YdiL (CAAX protease family)
VTTETSRRRLKVLVFLLLTFAATAWMPWHLLPLPGGMMWAPGFAAIATQLLFERRLAGLGWRVPPVRWLLAALAFPLAYVCLAYAVAWTSGVAELRPDATDWMRGIIAMVGLPDVPAWAVAPVFALLVCTLALGMNLLAATGEEIGWRGLLLPELARLTSARRAAIASGLIWALWHWHGILWNGYNAGADPLYSLAMFTLMIVLVSVGMAWLTLRTRSFWPAVIVHGGHNAFIQGAFEPLTVRPDTGQWITGEWGVALPVALIAVLAASGVLVSRRDRRARARSTTSLASVPASATSHVAPAH